MKRPLILLSLVAVLGLGAWGLWGPPNLAPKVDREMLNHLVDSAGAAGPVVIVGLMTLAVVARPIPRRPPWVQPIGTSGARSG